MQTDLSHSEIPPGGWSFFSPQTGWNLPNPVSVTFNQAVQLIIKHRMSNQAIAAKFGLRVDVPGVEQELDTYTRLRLGIPQGPPTLPKSSPPAQSADSLGAVAAVKMLASGAALLLDWETSGRPPVAAKLAVERASKCDGCPKNEPGHLSLWFTSAASEGIRKRLARLHAMNLTTPHDAKLGVCNACLCPLKLKIWTPIDLVLSHLKPEARERLWLECWITAEERL